MVRLSKRNLKTARRAGRSLMVRRAAGSFWGVAGFLIFLAATVLYYLPDAPGPSDKAIRAGLAAEFSGRVIRVHDGDTVTVKPDDGREVKIRLYGVDAPEQGQTYGPQASAYLQKMLQNKQVRVETQDLDQYGRIVGLIYLDEQLVNQALIQDGQAWVYQHYCKISLCRQFGKDEAAARSRGLGLWAEKEPHPPWEWRYLNRKAGENNAR